ncbi:Beta-barrel assembly machine subunit BamF [Tistlia consotensis]|uniref:Beta-barrel assembly machine subunit BamF n=1 Tax=Tistlia consotensis USBA 355 TaxID=560819 RepID=A0A1Y6CLR2_9PROT|nr:DUF3035 domain-containing protein [Tistlia consotensis]SMF71906.1 Beta-barrel assembly machine subunit BamF [Tistlia consotensis USBA 355]SNS05955.1 Beta-barrel assembly machine subunit BamF [Tistlia consotensis]
MMRRLALITIIGAAVGLSGCENVRQQFGLSKTAPDEFKVVSRAPLTVPPNFALRPPEPGATRPQEGTTRDQARQTVFRISDNKQQSVDAVIPDDGRSKGERALLMEAGVEKADPKIRQLVNEETNQIDEASKSLIDELVFWRKDEPPGEVINAGEESRRLREAQALGEPVTGKDAPIIERRQKGLLEGIF